ncbi:hypothetical protein CPB83DRAFT_725663, partial [Crepidotus variabilis]
SSPISNLPPELLSLIIVFARSSKRVPHRIPYEVSTSHVSRLWREITMGMPFLWTKIDMFSTHSKSWVSAYIERSGQLPLDFNIDIYRSEKLYRRGGQSKQQAWPLISDVVQVLHRVRSMNILCYRQNTAVMLQNFFTDRPTPLLESFKIQHGTSFSAINASMGLKAFVFNQATPCLTTFVTDTPNILPRSDKLRSLETLYWHGLDPKLAINANNFQHTLSSVTSLVHLSLQGTVAFGFWPTGMPAGPQFTLPNLKALRCLDGGGTAIRTLLAISAPKLESIWLECSFDNFPAHFFGAPQMNVLGHPKFPALKFLTLHFEAFPFSEQFAKVFPTVSHVHYFHVNLRQSDKLAQAMKVLWTSVNTLVFSRFRERDAEKLTTALSQIILTRALGVNPMQAILLDEDHLRFIRKCHTNSARDVQLLAKVLSRDNYAEPWW